MDKKFYNLTYLQKYQNKPFIYVRKSEFIEQIYNYDVIKQEVIICLQYFAQYQIEAHVGIAVNVQEHSAISCILLLAILNHNCHFYCCDVENTKDVENYLRLSGVKYIISSEILNPELISYENHNQIKVLSATFYIGTIKMYSIDNINLRLCYTIATSGSTGLPKMVHVPYECIEPNIKALSSLLKLQEDDIIFLGSPPTFDPFVVELFSALKNGAALLITSNELRLNPNKLIKILFPCTPASLKGVTILQITPSLFRLFGNQNIHDVILSNKSSLRCLILGGEEFPSLSELKSWLPKEFPIFGKRIFNIYGITEISCWSTIYELKLKNYLKNVRVPLGKPLDEFTEIRIIDEDEIAFSNDCGIGELLIGSSIRCCFIPQCDQAISILGSKDIIYRNTGDLVERDKFGDIYFIGRTNSTIKRLGKRICLDSLGKKIENLLNTENLNHKIICLWHKEKNKLILYINSPITTQTDKQKNIYILKQNLELHEQPDEIYYNQELPLNRHGKIDRKKLMEIILENNLRNTPLKYFKNFLKNVLGFNNEEDIKQNCPKKRIKLDLSFIDAGGTSFQALSLATEIADIMENHEEQHKILELLLDNSVTINSILEFLSSVTNKLEINTKNVREYCIKGSTNLINTFKLLWRCDLKKCIDASANIFQEKIVAVGSHSHLLLTLNTDTGMEISRIELPDRIECSVVFVSSDLALIGCYDGFLYGFNFYKGSILWKINVKGIVKAKPLVINNTVIIASYAEEYNVMAFDLKSLDCLWKLKLGSKGIFSSPLLISEESALICGLDGSYSLIEVTNGSIKWLQKLESPIFSTPAKIESSENLFTLAEVKGQILVCKLENGEKITSYQVKGNIFSGLTLHQLNAFNTLIIFGCHDKNVYCLNFETNTKRLSLLWKFYLNAAIYSTPIVLTLSSNILACSTKGLMVLLDLETSNLKASYDIKAEVFSTPCCLNDKLFYVGARDNFLYAFELE